jgi:hypothetical protein
MIGLGQTDNPNVDTIWDPVAQAWAPLNPTSSQIPQQPPQQQMTINTPWFVLGAVVIGLIAIGGRR